MREFINGALAYLGSGFIKKVAPDVVIATHATPAGIMSIYKRRKQSSLYLCGVVTDYTVHTWWICDGVDTYFIADERLRNTPNQRENRRKLIRRKRNCYRKERGWKERGICLLHYGKKRKLQKQSF